jgi:hypothetical protein
VKGHPPERGRITYPFWHREIRNTGLSDSTRQVGLRADMGRGSAATARQRGPTRSALLRLGYVVASDVATDPLDMRPATFLRSPEPSKKQG